jgi:hypothetical protein
MALGMTLAMIVTISSIRETVRVWSRRRCARISG